MIVDINSVSWKFFHRRTPPYSCPLRLSSPRAPPDEIFCFFGGFILRMAQIKNSSFDPQELPPHFSSGERSERSGERRPCRLQKKKITSTWLNTFKLPCTEETEHMFSLSRAIGLGVYSWRASFRVQNYWLSRMMKPEIDWNNLEYEGCEINHKTKYSALMNNPTL